jgi:hypothetical protein
MALDRDLKPAAGVMFAVVMISLLYASLFGIWHLATRPTEITDRIDPQPNLSQGVTP